MEGLSSKSMMSPISMRTKLALGALLLTAGLSALPAAAQTAQQIPNNVLLFSPVVDGDRKESTKLVEDEITGAIRDRLAKLGIAAVVYSRRLPSVQRALNEGDRVLTDKDLDAGPGDDPRKAQRFAEVVGSTEYLTVFVDGYSYDAGSRTAKFNLSLTRYNTHTSQPLGTFAKGQQGVAPADVAKARQEGSALARAAEVGAQQAVEGLFPKAFAAVVSKTNTPKPTKAKGQSREKNVIRAFGALLGVLYFSTR
jgi:hypothetical protein